MAIQDELREQLIKQFSADVMEALDPNGNMYYACPTCRRAVARSRDKCVSCSQSLNWENISKKELVQKGVKTATLTFEVPGDFAKADCRKCPLSYITKKDGENVYDCPLNMRNKCPLEILGE